ncbi:MAG: S8 family serine peptidase [Ignavibacteria bacterium]|nr:S8 family serine peptidase [Ignavibacteria bacterium]
MMVIKKILVVFVFIFAFNLSYGAKVVESNKYLYSSFVHHKFFVKTKYELKVSEATGKTSLKTGLKSLDLKIQKYKIKGIRKLFHLNNGNPYVYYKLGMNRVYVFHLDSNYFNNLVEIIKDFCSDDFVEFAEPVFTGEAAGKKDVVSFNSQSSLIPNDEMFYLQWYLKNDGKIPPSSGSNEAKVGADINMVNAWDIETGSQDVIVGIMDSGVKFGHPELMGRIWINKNEIPKNKIDDDKNGYVDDVYGWDFAYDDNMPDDGFGHGTNITGIIGANSNNTIGFAGINFKCKLMICKNLSDDNTGEYEWWAESVKYAVDNGAKIINMSEGGEDNSKVLKMAIDYAIANDALVIAAMMNKGNNKSYYPAAYPGVLAVGATDTDDKRCVRFTWGGGSCWGKHISVVAPGNKIYGLDYIDINRYDISWSGTSQSTAIVSGIASLLLSQNKNRTSNDIKQIITRTAKDRIGDPREDKAGWDEYYGYGRVDAYLALSYSLPDEGK